MTGAPTPPESLSHTALTPAWYGIERENVRDNSRHHVAVTTDGWSSVAQDHYLSYNVDYMVEAELREEILHTHKSYMKIIHNHESWKFNQTDSCMLDWDWRKCQMIT